MVANQTQKCVMSGRKFHCTNDPIAFLCAHPEEKYCESCPMFPPNYFSDSRKAITKDVYFEDDARDQSYVMSSRKLHGCGIASFAPLIMTDIEGGLGENIEPVAKMCKEQMQNRNVMLSV